MPADDSLFEKALARQMRNRTPGNGPGANGEAASGEASEQHKLCPNAEILAVYHDRLLASDEMNSWKGHISSCARCQKILSQLKATEDILVTANEEVDHVAAVHEDAASAMTTPPPLVFAARPAAVQELRPPAARTGPMAISAAGDAAAPVNRQRRTRSFWILPVGAIAASLLVWVGMHQQRKNVFHEAAVETADNRPSVPAPASPISGPAASDNDVVAGLKMDGEVSRAAHESPALEKKKAPAEGRILAMPKSTVASTGGAGRVPAKVATQNAEVSGEAGPVSQGQASGANVAPLATGQELQAAHMPAAAAPAPSSQNARVVKPQAPSFDAATALMRLQAETATASKSAGVQTVSQAQNTRMIPAPGGNIIWRVGKAGLVELSADAGASWTRQNSGVVVTLDSGSAPSAAVCWIFGGAGTILQTVDGGRHWTRIVSPIAGDIGGILAADAQHATIWDASKKSNFVTTDGGATWTRIANP